MCVFPRAQATVLDFVFLVGYSCPSPSHISESSSYSWSLLCAAVLKTETGGKKQQQTNLEKTHTC